MKKRRHIPKADHGKSAPALTPRRRLLFMLATLIIAPLLAFALAEAALRVAGYGYDTSFFKKATIQGKDFLINNDKFVLRFFPPQMARLPAALRMEAQKPPGVCRIFVLGESAALGDPSPPYGAGRYLQTLLNAAFHGEKFEVVNVSITAINSHVILPIARECAAQQGDFWIVYMGNNEMVGPFGAASVFGAQAPPVWAVRASLALQQTRVGQCLMSAVRDLKIKSATSASWGGMEMFLGNELPPSDPRKQQVYRNFQQNLHDIIATGVNSGARILLNTMAVNLKDCPPFASLPDGVTAEADSALKEGHFEVAAAKFTQAVQLHPESADAQYGLAECLSRQCNVAAAREHYQKACDCDALPFRSDSHINDLIRQAARELSSTNLVLLDTASALGSNNPAGVCGDETFLEHVHFTFDGNYRMALLWAEAIAPRLRITYRSWNGWLSKEACDQRLALTDWNRMLTVAEMMHRRRQPPLSRQANNDAELESLSTQLSALRQVDASTATRARALCLEDIQRDPDDYLLRFNYGDFLEGTKNWKDAAANWQQVEELLPQYYLAYFQEGRMLEHDGQLDTAETALRKAVALYPRMTAGWFELSNIHLSEGHFDSALQECGRASELEPGQTAFYVCEGTILTRMNRAMDAMEKYRKAIQIRPEYPDAHLALARALTDAGQRTEAAAQFQEVLHLDPGNQAAQQGLASLRQ